MDDMRWPASSCGGASLRGGIEYGDQLAQGLDCHGGSLRASPVLQV